MQDATMKTAILSWLHDASGGLSVDKLKGSNFWAKVVSLGCMVYRESPPTILIHLNIMLAINLIP